MRKTGFGAFRAPAMLTSANDNNMQIVIVASEPWELSFISAVAYSTRNPYPLPTDLNRPLYWSLVAAVGEIQTNCVMNPTGHQFATNANIQREILDIVGAASEPFMATFPRGGGPIIEAGEPFVAAIGTIILADGTVEANTVCNLTVWGRKLAPEGGTPNVILR